MASASDLFGDFLVAGGQQQATNELLAFSETELARKGRAAGGLDLLTKLFFRSESIQMDRRLRGSEVGPDADVLAENAAMLVSGAYKATQGIVSGPWIQPTKWIQPTNRRFPYRWAGSGRSFC